MFKVIGFLKRRPGMSIEEFRSYYETYHRVIGEKYLSGAAVKYMRRYLDAFPDPITGEPSETPYDVIMEIWYPDRETFEVTNARLMEPEIAAEIVEDEEKVFDRSKNCFFSADERESVMPPLL
jgi:hypothetical protein